MLENSWMRAAARSVADAETGVEVVRRMMRGPGTVVVGMMFLAARGMTLKEAAGVGRGRGQEEAQEPAVPEG